ncbi:MAG: hypothetical protein ACUVWN_10745 [bacterium]
MRKYLVTITFATLAFTLIFASSLMASFTDEFEGTSLKNPNWKWQNEPANWDVGKTQAGWLTFVPKVNQNLWSDDSTTRLYQETSADKIEVETHVVVTYKGECMVAGLVIKGPKENNWTTLKFWGRSADAIIQWQHKQTEVVGNVPNSTQPAGTIEAYLRMAKDGNNYMGWWKKSKNDEWIAIKPDAPIDLTPPLEVGIFGGICAGSGEATIKYEYFKDLTDMVTAIDSQSKLPVTWGKMKSIY